MNSVYDFAVRKGVLRRYRGIGVDVVIPDGVTTLGQYAFRECPNLRSVVMPDSVTAIHDRAFCQAEKLVRVTMSPNVTRIGAQAFEDCIRLEELSLPKGLTMLGWCAFKGCRSLSRITIPSCLETIEPRVFRECKQLTHVTVEEGAACEAEDFESLFSLCENLQVITAPGLRLEGLAVDYKPMAALGYLSNPELYRDPQKLEAYRRYIVSQKKTILEILFAMDLVPALQQLMSMVRVDADNFEPDFLSQAQQAGAGQCVAFLMDWKNRNITSDDIHRKPVRDLNKDPYNVEDMRKLWRYKVLPDGTVAIHGYKGEQDRVVIPPRIGNKPVTALGCQNVRWDTDLTAVSTALQSVTLPQSLTVIGFCAFQGCTDLTEVAIPDQVTRIGDHAFSSCWNLTGITLPDSVEQIGNFAFSHCEKLTAVVVPPHVTSIGDYAFSNCKQLRILEIPANVTHIGEEAFYKCPLLVIRTPAGSDAERYAKANRIAVQIR